MFKCVIIYEYRWKAQILSRLSLSPVFERLTKLTALDNPRSLLFSTASYIWKSRKRKYARRKRIAPDAPYEVLEEAVSDGESIEDNLIALYFAIADVMTFSNSTFLFNETIGEITINPDFDGVSAIFDLPLDKSLADPAKAALLLSELYPPADAESPAITESGDYVFQDEAVTLK